MNTFTKRILVGLLYATAVFIACTQGPYVAIAIFAVLAVVCWWEFVQLVGLKDFFYLIVSFLVSGFVFYYFASGFLEGIPPFLLKSMRFAPPALFVLVLITLFFSVEELYTDFAKATVAVVYIALPFALSFTIPTLSYETGLLQMSHELLGVFILIWASDTFAYFVGKKWGKTPLAKKISPNKTWEGALAGFVGTLLFGYGLSQISFFESTSLTWWIVALLVGFFAPIGDLSESKLKRFFGKKDTGTLLPGHGGFLDRLDSYLAVSPALYAYLLILNLMQ